MAMVGGAVLVVVVVVVVAVVPVPVFIPLPLSSLSGPVVPHFCVPVAVIPRGAVSPSPSPLETAEVSPIAMVEVPDQIA